MVTLLTLVLYIRILLKVSPLLLGFHMGLWVLVVPHHISSPTLPSYPSPGLIHLFRFPLLPFLALYFLSSSLEDSFHPQPHVSLLATKLLWDRIGEPEAMFT